jgi:hypothetical protein
MEKDCAPFKVTTEVQIYFCSDECGMQGMTVSGGYNTTEMQ